VKAVISFFMKVRLKMTALLHNKKGSLSTSFYVIST